MSPVIRMPDMPQVIAGTAGHVDHGKTALVKLLTGCDTDRLKEEKERGLSIDLGFAPCRIQGNRMIGIIDVPGHIDFIRNMVAGAASIDILILVIAADDGVMPQTKEHMQIIKLLRAPQVIVALTKKDLVDEDMLELAKEEVAEFMKQMGYPEAPIIPVSNITLDGISAFRDELNRMVDEFEYYQGKQAFRMNIGRVFSVKGYGTVVTGIPSSGCLDVGSALELLPESRNVRLRAVQSYKFDKNTAQASTCCALNISDIKVDDLSRGMVLCEPGVFRQTLTALVSLKNVHNELKLKHNMEYRFHSGTAEVKAKLKLVGGNALPPNSNGVGWFVFDHPLVLAVGDKFIIRNMSPSSTVAGGSVLWPEEYRYKRSDTRFLERIQIAAGFIDSGETLKAALVASDRIIVDYALLKRIALVQDGGLEECIAPLVAEKFLSEIGSGVFLVENRKGELIEQFENILKPFHLKYPYTWGMTYQDILNEIGIKLKAGREFLLDLVKKSDKIKAIHGRIALKAFSPALSKQQMLVKEKMAEMITGAACAGVSVNVISETLDLKKAELKLYTKILKEEGVALSLGKHFIATISFEQCIEAVKACFDEGEFLEVNQFRDKIETGRNMAVAILEKMDEMKITRRTEKGRILL